MQRTYLNMWKKITISANSKKMPNVRLFGNVSETSSHIKTAHLLTFQLAAFGVSVIAVIVIRQLMTIVLVTVLAGDYVKWVGGIMNGVVVVHGGIMGWWCWYMVV